MRKDTRDTACELIRAQTFITIYDIVILVTVHWLLSRDKFWHFELPLSAHIAMGCFNLIVFLFNWYYIKVVKTYHEMAPKINSHDLSTSQIEQSLDTSESESNLTHSNSNINSNQGFPRNSVKLPFSS